MSNTELKQESTSTLVVESASKFGSLEKAIKGDYQFNIGDVITESWKLTDGAKWDFQKLFFIYFLFLLAAWVINIFGSSVLTILNPDKESPEKIIFSVVYQILYTLFFAPMGIAILITGARRACGASIPLSIWARYYKKLPSIAVTIVLSYIMILIGLVFFVLPGIYLAIAYTYSTTLVAEKNMSPWQAMEASRKAIHKRWFSMFGFMLLMTLFIMISIIPLGIGLIWTMPMAIIAYGIIYRNMFGMEAESLTEV